MKGLVLNSKSWLVTNNVVSFLFSCGGGTTKVSVFWVVTVACFLEFVNLGFLSSSTLVSVFFSVLEFVPKLERLRKKDFQNHYWWRKNKRILHLHHLLLILEGLFLLWHVYYPNQQHYSKFPVGRWVDWKINN